MLPKHNTIQQFASRIEEVIHNHMIIAMPMEKGHPIYQTRGSTFAGRIYDESGVYAFKSTFIDRKMTPLPIWIVTMPFEVEKTQQRSFVRFDIALPIVVEYLKDGEEEEISLNLVTKDLSGGGLQIISERKIKIGKRVQLTLAFPEQGAVKVAGEIIRVHKPQDDRQLFWISIRFIDIQESTRDKISKFIFRKQLEQRQKGL